jgi:sugar-specific transcriptional regulator TrmB
LKTQVEELEEKNSEIENLKEQVNSMQEHIKNIVNDTKSLYQFIDKETIMGLDSREFNKRFDKLIKESAKNITREEKALGE